MIEHDSAQPGKYIRVNCDNDDDPDPNLKGSNSGSPHFWDSNAFIERILDFADGFDLDGSETDYGHNAAWMAQDNRTPMEDDFIPICLKFSDLETINLEEAYVVFTYSSSNPSDIVIYSPGSVDGNSRQEIEPGTTSYCRQPPTLRAYHDLNETLFRLWKKNGTEQRNPNSIMASSNTGDYIPANTPISLPELGISANNNQAILYLESVAGVGKSSITCTLHGGSGAPSSDTIDVSPVYVEFTDNGRCSNPHRDQPRELSFDATREPTGKMIRLEESSTSVKVILHGIAKEKVGFRKRVLYGDPSLVVDVEDLNDNMELPLLPRSFGSGEIEVYILTDDSPIVGKLRFSVLEKSLKPIKVFFNAVTDPSLNISSSVTEQQASDMFAEVEKIWKDQANIILEFAGYEVLSVEGVGPILRHKIYDPITEECKLGPPESGTSKCIEKRNELGRTGDINVFFYPEISTSCPETEPQITPPNGFAGLDWEVFMADPETIEKGISTLAHEFGHVFTDDRHYEHNWSTEYDSDALLYNNLMGYNAPGPDNLSIIDLTLRQGYIANTNWKARHDGPR